MIQQRLTGPQMKAMREQIDYTRTALAVPLQCTAEHIAHMENGDAAIMPDMEARLRNFHAFAWSLRGVRTSV